MRCPACTQEISDTAKFCRHCRIDLRQALPADPAPPAPSVEATSIPCPACATPIANSARFCKHCGERFETSAAGSAAAPPQQVLPALATEPLADRAPSDAAPFAEEHSPAPSVPSSPIAEAPHSKLPAESLSPQKEDASDHAPASTSYSPVTPEKNLDAAPEPTPKPTPKPTPEPAPEPPKTPPKKAIVAAAVLVLALGGGGWWWSQQEKMPASATTPESLPSTPAPVATETLPAVVPAPEPAAGSSTEPAAAHSAAAETRLADAEQAAEKKAAEKKAAEKSEDAKKAKKAEEAKAAAKQAAREKAAAEKAAADARAQQAAQAAKAPTPQPSAPKDWQSALRADLDACASQPFLLRLPCNEKARWKHCPGNWGKSEECKVSSNNQGFGG
ncbi:MAG: hypothetical protein C0466_14535 [Candidatus Accumulibacter sp.]|nr:hypothetical protein [Accumulibacter sp.]